MASRDLKELCPQTLAKVLSWQEACKRWHLDVIVTSTYRSVAEQDRLYAQGRTQPGAKVTNANGGQSYHNVRRAIDFVPLTLGKVDWNGKSPNLVKAAELGEQAGLKWGGRWLKSPDGYHLEDEWCEECQRTVGPSAATHFNEDGSHRKKAA